MRRVSVLILFVCTVVGSSSEDEEVCSADGSCKKRGGASYLQVTAKQHSENVQVRASEQGDCKCDKVPAPDRVALTEANASIDGEVTCEAFCQDSGCPCIKPWAERCLVRSCAGCAECGGNAYATGAASAPVAPPPVPVAPGHAPPIAPDANPAEALLHPLAFMVCPQSHQQGVATHVGGSIRKTACMTPQKYDAVSKSVADLLNSLPETCQGMNCPQADWAGCVLRMAGHDFMDYKDGFGGSDACTDMKNADNNGLPECLGMGDHGRALAEAYALHCGDVSLADFLVIAAESVMTETRKRHMANKPGAIPINFRDNFKFGRVTRVEDCAMGHLPNPDNSCDDVQAIFVENLGLNPAESAALMGVHTLGRAHVKNSGFDGWWSDAQNSRRFNNDYYIAMITKGWTFNRSFGPLKRSQWDRSDIGKRADEKEMMLNTDLCLAFSHMGQAIKAEVHDCCAWMDVPFPAGGVDPRVMQATGDVMCGGPGHDAQGKPIVGVPMRERCCQMSPVPAQATDCGSALHLTGFAAGAVMEFASNENEWVRVFQMAWNKVTANGHQGLRPLGQCGR